MYDVALLENTLKLLLRIPSKKNSASSYHQAAQFPPLLTTAAMCSLYVRGAK